MQAKINGAYVTTTPSVKVGGVYKPITNTFVKINGVYKDAGYLQKCYAYNFDGIDDRGVLQNRAINIEGDNTFEFWTPSDFLVERCILSQSLSPVASLVEFRIFTRPTNDIVITFGGVGTVAFTSAQGLKTSTRYGLTLIGGEFQLIEGGLGGLLVKSGTFTRGGAREPTASTLVGAQSSGGTLLRFFNGPQYDIKINGTLWSMADRNQEIQPSIPAGNNMTLVNTTSDRWEEVACNLRVTP